MSQKVDVPSEGEVILLALVECFEVDFSFCEILLDLDDNSGSYTSPE